MSVWQTKAIELVLRNSLFVAFGLVSMAGPVLAEDIHKSARTAADWAMSEENPLALADSIKLLLESGSALDPDDPFSVADLLDGLREMEGGASLAEELENSASRGQLDGARRTVVTLEPGETHIQPMTMVARESAFIEARLWRDSEGADIDMRVLGPSGETIADDGGPDSGIPGVGTFVEFWPETCVAITLEIVNRGDRSGRFAIRAPLSLRDTCEE